MNTRGFIPISMTMALLLNLLPVPATDQPPCSQCGSVPAAHTLINVQVLWQGDEPIQDQRPKGVEISVNRIIQDNNRQESLIPLGTNRITATSYAAPYMGWATCFTHCPDGRQTIRYEVKQNEGENIIGYHTEITSIDGMNFTITNVREQQQLVQTDTQATVYVKVFWNDNYNANHLRPKNVEITLGKEGSHQEDPRYRMTGLATSANGWACRFCGVDAETSAKYYVVKPKLFAYDTSMKQDLEADPTGRTFTITNTLKPYIVSKKHHDTAVIQEKKPAAAGNGIVVIVPKVPLSGV